MADAASMTPPEGNDPMVLCALVLGFNELAKNARTLGDRIAFRLYRDTANAALREMASPWVVTFSDEPTADDSRDVIGGGV